MTVRNLGRMRGTAARLLSVAAMATAAVGVSLGAASPVHASVNGWTEPVSLSTPAAGYLASGCNNNTSYITGYYHIGADYMASAGTNVVAVGSGTVLQNADFGAGYARAVLVQHRAADGSQFVFLYGHVNSSITAGAFVSAGQSLGTVATIVGSDPHLHASLFPGTSYPSSGWGMRPCASWPNQNSTVDPMAFLNAHGATGSSPSAAVSLIHNGGFNVDSSYWSASGGANLARYSAAANTTPYESGGFLAMNAPSGGSVYQQVAKNMSTADTFCVETRAVTIGSAPGGNVTLAVWLLGGASNENSTFTFSNLPGSSNWQPGKACVTATTAHTHVKVEFYPAVGGLTVAVDAVQAYQTLSANGGFNANFGYWGAMSGTNYATYFAAQGAATNPYEGGAYEATNSYQGGGSIFQDLPHSIGAGDTFCVDARFVTVGNNTGGGGTLAMWLMGGSGTEVSTYNLSNLPGGNSWQQGGACVTATGAHTTIRVQLYPNVNAPTIGVDALSVTESFIQNGGFNADISHWSPVGTVNYARYASYGSTNPYEGGGFGVAQAIVNDDSLIQDRSATINVGDQLCASAQVTVPGGGSGVGGRMAIWLLGPNGAENSVVAFTATSTWQPISVCVTATQAETNGGVVRLQLYPDAGGTLAFDAVSLV